MNDSATSNRPSAPVSLEELTADLALSRPVPADTVAQAIKENPGPFFVVLDDDPTGTQSVADLPVLTAWEEEDFTWALQSGASAVYVMTNSRSLDPQPAAQVNREVVAAASSAAEKLGKEVTFVSRSDSTLRGHFPLETDTISTELEKRGARVDGVVIIPAFGDAGRITVGGIHYAGSQENGFIPVGQSEFAKDATFGYENSDLARWVEEKSAGKYPSSQVIKISLDQLRSQDTPELAQILTQAQNRQPIICDIVTEDDLRLLSLALISAEAGGKRFVYRVGPPFMRARLGQDVRPPLEVAEIAATRSGETNPDRPAVSGGLIVVGSHVGVTTRQLARLEEESDLQRIQIDVEQVIDEGKAAAHLAQVIDQACLGLEKGNVVVSTTRKLIKGTDKDDSLRIARLVSAAVVSVVQGIIARVTPRFVVAKGGITSSDVAAKGLAMRHAWVIGPMLPGIVSLWSAQDGPAVGIPYIIFAGNVGDDNSLAQVVAKLSA